MRREVLRIVLVLLTGCASSPPPNPCAGRTRSLEEAVDRAAATGMLPGLVLRRDVAGVPTVLVRGERDLATHAPMAPDGLFRSASNGKIFLGTLAAILAEEGALDLDAPVAGHLDPAMVARLANGATITMQQLLDHTSGLPDFLENPAFEAAMRADPQRVFADEELVAYAFDRPATSPPGTEYRYSNTGYCVAALVIASVTGDHASVALRAKVLEPFGLEATFWENHEAFPGDRFVHGYDDLDEDGVLDDVGATKVLAGTGAGGLVTTADDLGRFYRALFQGDGFPADRLDRAALLARMRPRGDAHRGYGLGVVETEEGFSHSGRVPGYSSVVAYVPGSDTSIVLFASRTSTVHEGEDDEVDAVLEELWNDAVCPVL